MRASSPVRCWIAILLVLAVLVAPAAVAQVGSYGSFYQKKVTQPGGAGPGTNVNRYLYDKYFEKESYVSPYMSLGRPQQVSSYYQTVLPEIQRREAAQTAGRAYIQERKLEGNVGHTNYGFARQLQQGVPSAGQIPAIKAPSPYYNQFYGVR